MHDLHTKAANDVRGYIRDTGEKNLISKISGTRLREDPLNIVSATPGSNNLELEL